MAALDDINDIVAAFLVAAVDALDQTDAGAPGRAYTSSSRPALDCCGQVTAWPSLLGYAVSTETGGGLAEFKAVGRGRQTILAVTVQATRCAPTPKESGGRLTLPSPSELAAVSRQTSQDLWALWNHIGYELRHGALARFCAGAVPGDAVPVSEQGGCVGWELSWRYQIEGGYPFELVT